VPVAVDLTDLEALRRELEKNCANLAIDILVNNAGFDRPGTTSKIDKAGFEAVLEFTSPYRFFSSICASLHAVEKMGQDHQHQFDLRCHRRKRGSGVFHGQSRGDRFDQVRG